MKVSNCVGTLFKLGLGIVICLGILEFAFYGENKVRVTPAGITQKQITVKLSDLSNITKMEYLDPAGKAVYNGWGVNLAPSFDLQPTRAQVQYFPGQLSSLKFRQFNFMLIYTQDHVIQLTLCNFAVFCLSGFHIYSRQNESLIAESRLIDESLPYKCPSIDPNSVELTSISHSDTGYEVRISKQADGLVVNIISEKLNFKGELTILENGYDSQFYSNILSDDGSHYFMNNKKMSIPVLGHYSFKGKDYTIGKGESLALYDIGRAHFTYHTNWFWATFSTYLPDGRTFGVNIGDGIGYLYSGSDRATEDFILLNGTHIKLDITRLTYTDFMTQHSFSTVSSEERRFKNRACKLTFDPIGIAKDGVHFGIAGCLQYLIFGYWNGECTIDGSVINIEKVLGTVEHVSARW